MTQLRSIREKYLQVIVESDDQLLEFGRQQMNETAPPAVNEIAGGKRLVIAELQDTTVARRQLRLERIDSTSSLQELAFRPARCRRSQRVS